MDVLEAITTQGHEQVIAFQDGPSRLRGFLAIHSTRRGPALGGVRLLRYARERDALGDALRLSRAMTLSARWRSCRRAVARRCSSIIRSRAPGRVRGLRPPGGIARRTLLHRTGRRGPRRGSGRDRARTSHVARENDARLGDVAQHTAMGVSHALRACLEWRGLAPRGARVVIQGVGHVGSWLARILAAVGCDLTVADANPTRARQVARGVGGRVLEPGRALQAECEVLAPCALGGVLDARTIPRPDPHRVAPRTTSWRRPRTAIASRGAGSSTRRTSSPTPVA